MENTKRFKDVNESIENRLEEKGKLEFELQQLENKEKMIRRIISPKARKKRDHRLIVRGARKQFIDDIFSKSKVYNTGLYALDVELAVQLLSSFKGNTIYPKDKTNPQVFDEATKEREINTDGGELPEGEYFFTRKIRGFGEVKGTATVEDGVFKVLKGAVCAPTTKGYVPEVRKPAPIVNNILVDDVLCNSPSAAGWVIAGRSNNGWREWKDKDGQPIDIYRKENKE